MKDVLLTQQDLPGVLRSLFAELLGTFALTFVDAGGAVIAAVSHDAVTLAARSAASGLLVMAVIYAFGNLSGAHINPAVTFAFALRRDFPWRRVPFYWLAQVGGAVLAALFLLALFGNVDHLGATRPHYGTTSAFLMELALSCLLITVILNVATRLKVVGPNAALAAGGTVALCGLFAKPVSDASMNPARSLGPALVSGSLEQVWIYLAAPVLGALLAVLFMAILHGRRDPNEVEAATGDGS